MRLDKRFCARMVITAGLVVSGVSVFGLAPVHAQTTPSTAAPGPVRRLSIMEAVATAIEQNLDLQVQRLNPQIQESSIGINRANYTPLFAGQVNLVDQTQPSSSLLSGSNTSIKTTRNTFDFNVNQNTPWHGGSYTVDWTNGRTTSNNIFTSFDPQLTSTINASYTQPLLRNFRIDGTRQQILISQKNKEISDVQLDQSIAITIRNVQNAYYDLMYALGNLAVQRQSLDLAQQSLKDNKARVEIGTMAPIDIVQAEAEVATREESVILAEAAIDRAQDGLRTLVYNPSAPDFWSARIEPTESVSFEATSVDTDGAVKNALSRRTDLTVAKKQLESNDVNIRYFRNQSLPDLNASLNYNAQAIGGVQLQRGPSSGLTPGPVIGQVEKSFISTVGTTLAGDFPGWNFQVNVGYPIGTSSNEAQLARAQIQHDQAKKQLASLELQVSSQVREYARQVTTNAKRVDATRSSRVLAERRLEAEEKKYQAGMTSSFFVLQAQRDLNVARNNELLALTEYSKSVVNYKAVQQTPLF